MSLQHFALAEMILSVCLLLSFSVATEFQLLKDMGLVSFPCCSPNAHNWDMCIVSICCRKEWVPGGLQIPSPKYSWGSTSFPQHPLHPDYKSPHGLNLLGLASDMCSSQFQQASRSRAERKLSGVSILFDTQIFDLRTEKWPQIVRLSSLCGHCEH